MAAASGEIIIDGQTLTEENVWELRQKVGMVFQNPDNQFVGSTVEDDVAFGMENHGVPREEMLARVQCSTGACQYAGLSNEGTRASVWVVKNNGLPLQGSLLCVLTSLSWMRRHPC
jgi:energy-coupling factor transporter ATP-binding protein EcfA2